MERTSHNSTSRWTFPSWFRLTVLLVGTVEVFLGILSLSQGSRQVMSQFGIPEVVVNSPHYLDAMTWVVLHMTFLGTILVVLGVSANEPKYRSN